MTARRLFWLSLGGFFVIIGGWSLATPLMAATDEPAHAVKAAAVVRLDIMPDPVGRNGLGTAMVPALFAQAALQYPCVAFHPNESAQCQPGFSGDVQSLVPAVTSVSQANPLYYAVAGIPTLLPVGTATLYLMRLITALAVAALAALTVRTLAETTDARWPVVGAVLAMTPMAVFLGSTINPLGVEVMAAALLWVTLLALIRDPHPDLNSRRLLRFTIATVLLVNTDGLGPLLLLMILGTALLAGPGRQAVMVLTDRRSWPYLVVCAAASLLAVAWILLSSTRSYGSLDVPPTTGVLTTTLGLTSRYLTSMLGVFGWQDTEMPGWSYLALAAVLGTLLMVMFAVAKVRDRLVILLLGGLVVALPVAVHAVQAAREGFFWQGAFALPLAVGVPVLAGFALRDSPGLPAPTDRNLLRLTLLVVTGVQFVAFASNLHRYVNGASGAWRELSRFSWLPPLHPYLLVAVVGAVWLAVGALWLRVPDARAADVWVRPEPDTDAVAIPLGMEAVQVDLKGESGVEGDGAVVDEPGLAPAEVAADQDSSAVSPTTTTVAGGPTKI